MEKDRHSRKGGREKLLARPDPTRVRDRAWAGGRRVARRPVRHDLGVSRPAPSLSYSFPVAVTVTGRHTIVYSRVCYSPVSSSLSVGCVLDSARIAIRPRPGRAIPTLTDHVCPAGPVAVFGSTTPSLSSNHSAGLLSPRFAAISAAFKCKSTYSLMLAVNVSFATSRRYAPIAGRHRPMADAIWAIVMPSPLSD